MNTKHTSPELEQLLQIFTQGTPPDLPYPALLALAVPAHYQSLPAQLRADTQSCLLRQSSRLLWVARQLEVLSTTAMPPADPGQ